MAVALPHVVPPRWYGNDADRQTRFADQIKDLPVPPKTEVLSRYARLESSTGSGGDFHVFRAGFRVRTHLSLQEFRRFYAPYRFRSAIYTMPFDGTKPVPVTITHDGRMNTEGSPKPGGMIIRIEIVDVARDNFVRTQQAP